MNGVIILISQELEPLYARFHKQFPSLGQRKGYQAFQIVRTFFLMGSLRMFDCYGDVPLSFSMFFSMFRDFDLRALTVDEFFGSGTEYPTICDCVCRYGVNVFRKRDRTKGKCA